jgi:hypothetical protein
LLSADGVDCDAYDSDLSHRLIIVCEAGEYGLWLGLMLSGEEFESAPLLREVCNHLRFSLEDE